MHKDYAADAAIPSTFTAGNVINFDDARRRLRAPPEQEWGLRLATLPDPTTIPPRLDWANTVYWALVAGEHNLAREERRFLISLSRSGHPSAMELSRLKLLAQRLRYAGCKL